MRKIGYIVLILVLPLFLTPPAIAGEVWKITSLDWQPYSGDDMATQGTAVDKLRNLLKKADIELVVEFYPWERAQKLASKKGYVGYFPAWPEEVTKGFKGSKPVDWSKIGVLTYEGSGLNWSNLPDLFKNNKVGLIKTYTYPAEISKQAKTNSSNVDQSPDELTLLKKLSAKRFKAAITDPSVMLYLAKKKGISNIKVLKELEKKALVVSFRDDPENQPRIEKLDNLLNK